MPNFPPTLPDLGLSDHLVAQKRFSNNILRENKSKVALDLLLLTSFEPWSPRAATGEPQLEKEKKFSEVG